MIQIYLLILIIIFILFLILKKEPFTVTVSSCQIGEVKGWDPDQYLIGCASYDEGGIFIKLFWNKTHNKDDKYYIILTETKDKTTQIIDFKDTEQELDHKTKDGEEIRSYKLDKDNIKEGLTYNITLNIETAEPKNIQETDEPKNIRASNTLEITALKQQIPDNNIQLSGNCNKQTKLFDNLKNKTFDFYL